MMIVKVSYIRFFYLFRIYILYTNYYLSRVIRPHINVCVYAYDKKFLYWLYSSHHQRLGRDSLKGNHPLHNNVYMYMTPIWSLQKHTQRNKLKFWSVNVHFYWNNRKKHWICSKSGLKINQAEIYLGMKINVVKVINKFLAIKDTITL